MGIRKSISSSFRSLIQPRRWADYDRIKQSGNSLYDWLKVYFIPQRSKRKETMEQAVSRLHLSERDLQKREHEFLMLALVMFLVTLSALAYTTYLFISGHLIAGSTSIIISGVAAALSFRYHFWYFQTKQRRLGCSLKEWFRIGILGKRE